MRNLIACALAVSSLLAFGEQGKEKIGELTWVYDIQDGEATVQYVRYEQDEPTGSLYVPDRLGGCPVRHIGTGGLSGLRCVSHIELPYGLKTIGVQGLAYCTNMYRVGIPPTVVDIKRQAFMGCDAMGIDGPIYANGWLVAYKGEDYPEIMGARPGTKGIAGGVFWGMERLSHFAIPKSVRYICECAFVNAGLTSIDLPEGVEFIGDEAFRSCPKLESVTLPLSLKTVYDSSFENCRHIREITMPSTGVVVSNWMGLTQSYTLSSVFLDSRQTIERCTIPYGTTKIDDVFFAYCTALTKVKIPSSIREIGFMAFSNCTKLEEVRLPSRLAKYGYYPFMECTGMKRVTFCGSPPEYDKESYKIQFDQPMEGVYLGYEDEWAQAIENGKWCGMKMRYGGEGERVTPEGSRTLLPEGLTNPVDVPNRWAIDQGIVKEGESAALADVLLEEHGANGIPRYASYLYNLNAETNVSADAQLKVVIRGFDEQGQPIVTSTPTPNNPSRVLTTTLGKPLLDSSIDWIEVTPENKPDMRFFKIRAEIVP